MVFVGALGPSKKHKMAAPQPPQSQPQVLRAVRGRVPVREVLGTRKFDMGVLQQSAGWIADMNAWEAQHAAQGSEWGGG